MKNKKLFAAAMTAALAVSMMGTSVMAYEGKTNFKYTREQQVRQIRLPRGMRKQIRTTGWYIIREILY